MISLTYFSTAVDRFEVDELEELLVHSRANNHAAGLTGMLLYAGGHFIQTLEGDELTVEQTFDRISRDPRHREVFVTLSEDIDQPAFPDWSMGFGHADAAQAAMLPVFTDYLEAKDAGAIAGPRVEPFHRIFRDKMR